VINLSRPVQREKELSKVSHVSLTHRASVRPFASNTTASNHQQPSFVNH
jgi:hypothetical protein